MTDQYKHRPQSDQVKYISKINSSTSFPVAKHMGKPVPRTLDGPMALDVFNLGNNKNIVILVSIALVLMALLFLGLRNIQNAINKNVKTVSEQLGMLSNHQQLILKTQYQSAEASKANIDALRGTIAAAPPPPQMSTSSVELAGNKMAGCDEDPSGQCGDFVRRTATIDASIKIPNDAPTVKPQVQVNVLPRLKSAGKV